MDIRYVYKIYVQKNTNFLYLVIYNASVCTLYENNAIEYVQYEKEKNGRTTKWQMFDSTIRCCSIL